MKNNYSGYTTNTVKKQQQLLHLLAFLINSNNELNSITVSSLHFKRLFCIDRLI